MNFIAKVVLHFFVLNKSLQQVRSNDFDAKTLGNITGIQQKSTC